MSYSFQNVKPRMKYAFFRFSRWNIVFIHKNIPYLLPSSALTLSGFGPPDHESLLVLLWSHFKSAIEHFYIKIKRVSTMFSRTSWRLAPWNSSNIFYWPFQGGTSLVDHLCYFCLVFVMLSRVCLLMPCDHLGWRADVLALVSDV